MDAAEITRAIIAGNLTNAELNQIVDAVTFARARLGKTQIRTMTIGSTVTFDSKKIGAGVTGKVTKIGRKFVIVNTTNNGSWRVPANMLTVI